MPLAQYEDVVPQGVWDRVRDRGGCSLDPGELKGLIARERQEAAVYLYLSRRTQGRESQLLRKLFEEEQAHAACLKGIYTLLTGERLPIQSAPPPQEPMEVTLRRCYGMEMRSLAAYEARSADPEYGRVFESLARQERAHCGMVLELLGRMEGRG